jgi:hypothetical protein
MFSGQELKFITQNEFHITFATGPRSQSQWPQVFRNSQNFIYL